MNEDERKRLENYMYCKSTDSHAVNTIKYEWILDFMDEKYEKGKYRDFIVNFLLLHYCCRNADVDCLILTEDDFVGCDDEKENYLIIRNDGKIEWHRCNYKTNKTLTALTYVIDDERFIFSVKELHKQSCFLFENGEERIDRRSIGRVVANATYQTLGQALYFEIVKKHFKNDADMLYQLSQTRPVCLRSVVY